MKIGLSLLFGLCCFWLVYTQVTGQAGPHLLSEDCQSCHLATGTITAQNARLLLDSQEVLCLRCHPNALEASHPSGISPSRTVPANFPLDWQGNLTCSSCHKIHGQHKGLMVTELKGKALCHSCHDDAFFKRMRDGGQSLFVSGHLVAETVNYGEFMDAFSAQCITCHAKQKGDLNVSYATNGIISHSGSRVNHPIGRDYQTAANFGGYRPLNRLDQRISLPNGKISCISCHRAYDKEHGKNVMGNERSNLCYQCHDL